MAQPFKHPATGIYYLRRRVPRELRQALGHEYKKSLGTRDPGEAKRLHALEWANCEAAFAGARAQAEGAAELSARDAEILAGRWFQQELAKVDASGRYEQWLAAGPGLIVDRPDGHEVYEELITLQEALENDGEDLDVDVEGAIRQVLKEHRLPRPRKGSATHSALTEAFRRHWFKVSEVALARHNSNWQAAPATLAGEALGSESNAIKSQTGRRLLTVFEEYATDRLNADNSRGVKATLDVSGQPM